MEQATCGLGTTFCRSLHETPWLRPFKASVDNCGLITRPQIAVSTVARKEKLAFGCTLRKFGATGLTGRCDLNQGQGVGCGDGVGFLWSEVFVAGDGTVDECGCTVCGSVCGGSAKLEHAWLPPEQSSAEGRSRRTCGYSGCDLVMKAKMYVATHTASTGSQIANTRAGYVAVNQLTFTRSGRDLNKVVARGGDALLGRGLAEAASQDPARVLARAAKSPAQMVEIISRTSSSASQFAETAGKDG